MHRCETAAAQKGKSKCQVPRMVSHACPKRARPPFHQYQYLSVTGLVHSKYTRARTLNTYLSRRSRPLNHSTHRLTHCSHMAHTRSIRCVLACSRSSLARTLRRTASHTRMCRPRLVPADGRARRLHRSRQRCVNLYLSRTLPRACSSHVTPPHESSAPSEGMAKGGTTGAPLSFESERADRGSSVQSAGELV